MDKRKFLNRQRVRRAFGVRKRVQGCAETPRLSVSRSGKHISCQLIDDFNGVTLASASTKDKALRDSIKYGGNCEAATAVGKAIAEKAVSAGIKAVRFDRGAAKYHGRIAALADAAREGGLQF